MALPKKTAAVLQLLQPLFLCSLFHRFFFLRSIFFFLLRDTAFADCRGTGHAADRHMRERYGDIVPVEDLQDLTVHVPGDFDDIQLIAFAPDAEP